jgi:hypothetical protein
MKDWQIWAKKADRIGDQAWDMFDFYRSGEWVFPFWIITYRRLRDIEDEYRRMSREAYRKKMLPYQRELFFKS